MTFQKSFVFKKIEEILGYLEETKNLFKNSDKAIIADSGKLHIAERLLQLVVDTMIDINQHFIRELNLKISEDYQGTFYILGENGILPENFTKKIAPIVGLRNRIVHRYETIDKSLFIKTFRKRIPDFKEYLGLINQHLKKIK